MMKHTRQLPVRLPPYPDELLSSWINRHATFYAVPPLVMLRHCLPEASTMRAADLHLCNVGARPLRRAEKGEQFGVEASLARAAGHLHSQDRCLQCARQRIEARWVLVSEPLHDHGLAHATVPVDRDRGHARASRMIKERTQPVERLLGAWVEHPAA